MFAGKSGTKIIQKNDWGERKTKYKHFSELWFFMDAELHGNLSGKKKLKMYHNESKIKKKEFVFEREKKIKNWKRRKTSFCGFQVLFTHNHLFGVISLAPFNQWEQPARRPWAGSWKRCCAGRWGCPRGSGTVPHFLKYQFHFRNEIDEYARILMNECFIFYFQFKILHLCILSQTFLHF